jgi:diapolycopene oxygenase
MRSAIVIGGGVGGLAAAVRLACKGYRTTLFEANGYLGGKLTQFEQDGYRFDAGPSLFTQPENVAELFALAGVPMEEHLQVERLDPICRYFWADGTQLTATADAARFAAEVEQKLGVPKQAVLAHLDRARGLYSRTEGVFLRQSLHKLSTYLKPSTWWSMAQLPRIDGLRSMHRANVSNLGHPKLVQLFDRYATYNGSDPYRAPATLNLIPHLEFGQGAYFPEGGMHRITEALAGLARHVGVELVLNARVEQIVTSNGNVSGVRANGTEYSADVVVSNADVHATYRRLLPHERAPERALAQERSTSGLIFYWGIARQFPELLLHNVFFSADYQREFDELFQQKTIPTEPTIYLNISSKHARNDAPAGHENWFAMINTPPDAGQDWAALIPRARATMLRILSERLGVAIEPLITTESVLEPRIIEARTSSVGGSLYGTASNSPWSAFFRHPNFSRRLRGLYFVGGSVHPGGGIPLCLRSAEIAVGLVPKA